MNKITLILNNPNDFLNKNVYEKGGKRKIRGKKVKLNILVTDHVCIKLEPTCG